MAPGPGGLKVRHAGLLAVAGFLLAACTPEVGSDAWCKDMDSTPKADWSANDVAAYAKHCVLGLKPEKQ